MDEKEQERLKRILEGDKEGLYPEEEKIVKKAVPFGQRRQNLKHFIFSDTETLIHDIQQIYPATMFIAIVNNDERDSANIPRITFRTLEKLTINIHKVNTYSGHMYSQNISNISASVSHILCVVENGFVTVKNNKLKFEGD